MVMESWGTNEYRTFITSRRDDVFESRDASAFSFKRASLVASERDVYFDTDAKVPIMRTTLRNADFSFKCAPQAPVVAAMPVDDVFHPVYRKQDIAAAFAMSQRTVPEPFSQMSPHSLSRMYQPKYSKFCVNSTDVPPVETAMDSQSSSFRSQTSVCERDAGDCTTSRDSNGSSNDASSVSTDTTFDRAFDNHAATPTKPAPHPTDRRSVVTDEKTPPPNTPWILSPLKWKAIFASRKPPKPPQHDPPAAATTRPMSRLFNPPNCDDKNLLGKPKSFLALPVKPPPHHPGCSDSSDVRSVLSSDRERDVGGILRIRECWMKYMRMLKPPFGPKSATSKTVERSGGSLPTARGLTPTAYVHTRAKSMPAILKTPPLRSRSNSVFQPVSAPAPARSSMMPPAGPSSAKKKSTSFMAQSSPRVTMKSAAASPRLMSLSPRVTRTSPKVSSSSVNTNSPRMSSSSASSMSELHSAVQGAIAHCKQSHSGLLSPSPHRH